MFKGELQPDGVSLIAGPCSIDPENVHQIYQMADIRIRNKKGDWVPALAGARIVGLKSRTEFNATGDGMGIDFQILDGFITNKNIGETPPSVLMAKEFIKETGMGTAAEVMIPEAQMYYYEQNLSKGKFFPWTPAVSALGWPARQIGITAARNDWTVGLKNPKWLGQSLDDIEKGKCQTMSSMEKTWRGLANFASSAGAEIAFVHRGVDIDGKGKMRNALVHEIVRSLARTAPQTGRYFDPSHSYGPDMQDCIVAETIRTMKMRVNGDNGPYLYTGILVEVGDSTTDTKQHISVSDLQNLAREISQFRPFIVPKSHYLM
ncbi:hypothetical protein A3J20_05075 [Candidatus Gottesmanbacteria bacterium RIFCSPLOWO2_02_FULL_42_29]|uniref:Uncharacterized protein n=1 Tax=Candidatus Gottesmanbacteria bacterium RIFCSPLOWO2_01_FULL_42_22 TaxID=1798391 RepID=A0A1F6B7J8_9BACT|nr:MAG: hypothetical protein UV46_C0001G0012 [Candidatus Gottesmanbacteria bacterium GW2011_GWC2_42_8]OGG12366.1 MAG: hypothetical protein A2781_06150 [Candidatus Gottesmanbacteria bacterium RIFCSPHIGHO2_01_FULL_42_27]OGG19483.1 MAG: hypothetical protein A3E72_06865 [Candidatus Gottesmanbacteria bacterium RIFCSPHIGHO2_12_FULL_43_26]OGG32906.1 MAG: hypothetical protein A2968_06565 [Candidatus Gottesmanbacteria bacterium RIFCSPLOWO2_01_FULL_42_22]OGG36402.1 MAG: hypothetical protein A3J20_05075 [